MLLYGTSAVFSQINGRSKPKILSKLNACSVEPLHLDASDRFAGSGDCQFAMADDF